MILAEALPDPGSAHSIGWVLLTLGALAAGMIGFDRLIRRSMGISDQQRTIGGQPIKVQSAPPFVTRDELDRTRESITDRVARVESSLSSVSSELTVLRSQLHATETRINSAGEDRAAKIHERINDVLEAVSEVRGHVQAMDHGNK